MTQLPEPSLWEWIGFFTVMACVVYGGAVAILDRVPADLRGGLQHLLFRSIPRGLIVALGTITWCLAWLGAGIVWVCTLGRVFLLAPSTRVNTFRVINDDYVAQDDEPAPQERNSKPVAEADPEPRNVIAMASSERNEVLPRNVVTAAQADIIARLMRSETLYIPDGKGGYKRLGQTALIRLAMDLEPNGRPDSTYGQLKAELDQRLKSELTINGGRSGERVIAK